MPYIEMTIDSLRHAMHKDEWLILLKDKAGQRYLPVYVDKACADAIARIMMNEMGEEVIDTEIEQMLAISDDVRLLIDDTGDGRFKTRFVGRGCENECPVGKGLAVAVKGEVGIVAEEGVLDRVGVGGEV